MIWYILNWRIQQKEKEKKFTSNIKKFIGEDEKKTEKIRSETLLKIAEQIFGVDPDLWAL